MSYETRRCQLCDGRQGIKHQLVRWVEPVHGRDYDVIDRCADRAACRARLQAAGKPWPVLDPEPAR